MKELFLSFKYSFCSGTGELEVKDIFKMYLLKFMHLILMQMMMRS